MTLLAEPPPTRVRRGSSKACLELTGLEERRKTALDKRGAEVAIRARTAIALLELRMPAKITATFFRFAD